MPWPASLDPITLTRISPQFLYDASIYYLTLGFVVFRFTTLPLGDGDLLLPITILIHDIE